jgi:hypothetical protein
VGPGVWGKVQSRASPAPSVCLLRRFGKKKMADQKLTEITQGMVNNEALRTGNIQPQ